jgi:hypothetical protein
MKAKKKVAKDKSTAEMKNKKKKAKPTAHESCRHMSFCLGPDYETASKALIALHEKGLEVHDVTGDGNCGCHCLLVGLAVLGVSKPANQTALRKRLQEKAEHCRTVSRQLPMFLPFDDEGFEEECSYDAEQLCSEELTHTPREFMEKKNKKGEHVNEQCWMDLTFAVSLFCCDCRLRVVAHCSNGDTWSTCIFDGRDVVANDSVDGLRVQFLEGMVPITGCEKSFGSHCDGEHYEHLTLPVQCQSFH